MPQIKFRGIDIDTGDYVYGDFVHYVPMSTFPGIVDVDGFVHEIKPDSVKQLVGFHSDGTEIYNGDIIPHNEFGMPFSAELHVGLKDIHGKSDFTRNEDYLWIFGG